MKPSDRKPIIQCPRHSLWSNCTPIRHRQLITISYCTRRLSVVNHFAVLFLYILFKISCPYTSVGKAYSKGNGNLNWSCSSYPSLFSFTVLPLLFFSTRRSNHPHVHRNLLNTRKRGNSPKMEVQGDEPVMPDCFSPFVQISVSFFILELQVISRSTVNVSWPGNDFLISIRTECEVSLEKKYFWNLTQERQLSCWRRFERFTSRMHVRLVTVVPYSFSEIMFVPSFRQENITMSL